MSATYARVPLPPDDYLREKRTRVANTRLAARAAMADAIEAWLARDCDQTDQEISGVRARPLFSLELLRADR